jgi:metal-responsive CopG/Arc/MetJ family transcriptional regulator
LWVNTVAYYITVMTVNPDTTVRKLVSLPRDLVRDVEDFRFSHRIKTESEAIRALIRAGLDAVAKESSKSKAKGG